MTHLHFDRLDSTNQHLKRLIQADPRLIETDCLVITADQQENGRGQQNKTWESQPGKNLLMSVLLKPACTPKNQFHICRLTSIAVAELLIKKLNIEKIAIKWSNDIYAGSKKIAGILIEHSIQAEQIKYSIVGIGLNVNQANFPQNIPNPTSIFLQKNTAIQPQFCMNEIIQAIKQLSNENPKLLETKYEQLLYKKDQNASFIIPKISNQPINAKIRGVTQTGLLHIETENQHLFHCSPAEITYLDG